MCKKADIVSRVAALVQNRALPAPGKPVLAMVSGGLDSVSLAYILHELHAQELIGQPVILHVNHKIRGKFADEDANFVAGLAQYLDMPFFNCEVDIPALVASTGGNLEALARQERYTAARDAVQSCATHFSCNIEDVAVCTAHTASDRVENFYMRSIVGTGPGGLQGIHHESQIYGLHVVRPLLEESRTRLREYLESLENPYRGEQEELWREDVTNEDTHYFRAYVRKEIIPFAKKRNPQLEDTLSRTMNLIAEEDAMLQDMAQTLILDTVEHISEYEEDGFVCLPSFADAPVPLKKRAFYMLFKNMLGYDERIEQATIDACLRVFGVSGAVENVQNDTAISYNEQGLRVEPMQAFRRRRKK